MLDPAIIKIAEGEAESRIYIKNAETGEIIELKSFK